MRRTALVIAGAVLVTGAAVAADAASRPHVTVRPGAGTTAQHERPAATPPAAPGRVRIPAPRTPVQPSQRPVVVTPEAPLMAPGDRGPEVRDLQARLRQIGWFFGDVTDLFGDQTREAVAGFQAKRGFEPTGSVDRRTLARLHEMTSTPTADELANVRPDPADGAPLDPRCLTGRVLCVDKTSSSLRWVVDGQVQLTLDARFGGNGYVTREGVFSVYRMSADHVSNLYDTSMPFAMFFSGGQAVHYSPDFAANGYAGASHGCVNIRDYDEIAWLFGQVRIGDKVVVSWS